MPARTVRSEIVASVSLSRVSMLADLTFRNLILVVDDYGRIDGRLPILKGLLYPTRPEVTERKIEGWLAELAAGPNAPILRYEVDGRPYIQLTGWEKHRGRANRANRSKWPAPDSGSLPEIPGESGRSARGSRVEGRESRDEGRVPIGDLREARGDAAPPSEPSRDFSVGPSERASSRPGPAKLTPVPDQLSAEDRRRVHEWAARQSPPLNASQLNYAWGVYHAKARAKGYVYADHAEGFMNALGATGEAWALNGYGEKASKASRSYRRDESGQVLVPNEWRGLGS